MSLENGHPAPAFSAPAVEGETESTVNLADYAGKNLVLYFYPRDSTPGCTREAQDFRDLKAEFDAANTVILGVSKDTIRKHKNFIAKQEINFPLISDEETTICEDYGVWQEKKNYGKTYMGIVRSTFLIDAKGNIAQSWTKVKVADHAQAVLEAAKAL